MANWPRESKASVEPRDSQFSEVLLVDEINTQMDMHNTDVLVVSQNIPIMAPPISDNAPPQSARTPFRLSTAMNTSEMVETALVVLRGNWQQFLITGMFLISASLLLNAFTYAIWPDQTFTPTLPFTFHYATFHPFLSGNIVTALITALVFYPFVSAITHQIVRNFAGGYRTSLGTASKHAAHLLPQLSIATVLVWIAAGGGLLVLTPAILLLLTATRPVIIFEHHSPLDAMSRSWTLMRRHFWQYLVARIALIGLFLLCSLVATVLANMFAVAISVLVGNVAAAVAAAVLFCTITALSSTLSPIATCLIYLDARIRFESFDPSEAPYE